jgi:hypothetical protein
MKWSKIITISFVLFACSNEESYDPDERLTPQEKAKFIDSIIRYTTKPPRKIGEEERFNPAFDEYFQTQAKLAKLEYYTEKDGYEYFLLSQPAPSLTVKRHATGGRLKSDESGNLEDYEEIFRTWKMTPDTLVKRGKILFKKMVAGEDLTKYYPQNSGGTEYIEFPDDRTYYDKTTRKWKVRSE